MEVSVSWVFKVFQIKIKCHQEKGEEQRGAECRLSPKYLRKGKKLKLRNINPMLHTNQVI